jgi:AcrR family transcriptional regulator
MVVRKSSDSRRREIADAALRIIADQGLSRFTALAVAREVGLTDAALFRHFDSMDDIVLAVVERVGEILFEGFPPPGRDPLERLGTFFHRRLALIRDNPGVARLIASGELAHVSPPEGVARVAEFRRRSQSFVRRCLAEAHREGLLAEGLEPAEAAVLVVGSLLALTQARGPIAAAGASEVLPGRVWMALDRLFRRAPHVGQTPGPEPEKGS